jgi:hypothetical protein
MNCITKGKPVTFETITEIFDTFDDIHANWETTVNFIMTFVDKDEAKYAEEMKQVRSTQDMMYKLREDCGAALFYLIGKTELYKLKFGELPEHKSPF